MKATIVIFFVSVAYFIVDGGVSVTYVMSHARTAMGETLVTQLTILGTNIRQDANGRYSLGDCWQLSGKVKSNQPSEWYASTKTQEFLRTLAGELENGITQAGDRGSPVTSEGDAKNSITPVEVVKYGPNEGRGFWGNKEAVIHYAMWINPEFCLTVIRAFDAMVTGRASVEATPMNDDMIVARALQITADKVKKLEQQVTILAPKAEGFDRFANSTGRTILREVGKALHIGSKRGIDLLREKKWTFRAQNGKWHAYSAKVDAGLLDVKYVTYTNSAGEEISTQQVYVTPKGMARLALEMGQN